MKIFACLLGFLTVLSPPASAQRYRILEESAIGPAPVGLLVLRDESAGLEAAIAPDKGGELSGLRVRHKGQWIETIYLARDYTPREGWTGKAPFLWPATGRNFQPGSRPGANASDGSYKWDGRNYDMPIHGFVRFLPWKVETRRADDSGAVVQLSVRDTKMTRSHYPFGFRISVEYLLAGGKLGITYTVEAPAENSEPMVFSAGNHITFRAPFLAGSDPQKMLFETPSTVEYLKAPPGLPTGETRPKSFAKPVTLGEVDATAAISLGGYGEQPYMLLKDPQGLAIRLTHSADTIPAPPVVQFNVWGNPREGYFSPEPWVGLQNSFNLRKGLVSLKPGGRWQWRLELRAE